jgi:hypothetical protein
VVSEKKLEMCRKVSTGRHFQNGCHNTAQIQHCSISKVAFNLFFKPVVIIGPGSHIEYPTGTKNRNFVEDDPRNIPSKLGFNWPNGFGEEA